MVAEWRSFRARACARKNKLGSSAPPPPKKLQTAPPRAPPHRARHHLKRPMLREQTGQLVSNTAWDTLPITRARSMA